MIFFCVFARVRACFRGYLPLNCHHDLRRKCPYLLGFLRARPLPIARPAPSNVRALWPQASPPSRSNVTPGPLAWVPGRTSRRRRLGRQAVAIGKPRARSRSSSRRGRRRVDRHAVAAFILSTVPGPCSSWRGRREDREAVAVCMAMPRGAFWRCLACGQSFVGGMVGNRHGGK